MYQMDLPNQKKLFKDFFSVIFPLKLVVVHMNGGRGVLAFSAPAFFTQN